MGDEHFLELLRPRDSLSTVPSFHDNFFARRCFSRNTSVSGGAGAAAGAEEEEGEGSMVTVTDPDDGGPGLRSAPCLRLAPGRGGRRRAAAA